MLVINYYVHSVCSDTSYDPYIARIGCGVHAYNRGRQGILLTAPGQVKQSVVAKIIFTRSTAA